MRFLILCRVFLINYSIIQIEKGGFLKGVIGADLFTKLINIKGKLMMIPNSKYCLFFELFILFSYFDFDTTTEQHSNFFFQS